MALPSSMGRLGCCDNTAEIKSLQAPARTGIVPSGPKVSPSSLAGGACTPESKMRNSYAADDEVDANQQSMTLSPTSVVVLRRPPVFRRSESSCFEPVQQMQRSEVSLLLRFHQDQVHCDAAEDGLAGLKFLPDDFNLFHEEGGSTKSRLKATRG